MARNLKVQLSVLPCLAFPRSSQRVVGLLGYQSVCHAGRMEENEWAPYRHWFPAAPGVFKGQLCQEPHLPQALCC